jgi:hypothetical protein
MNIEASCRDRMAVKQFRLRRLFVSCVVVIVVSCVAFAQPKPDLTGTWTGSFTSAAPPLGSGDSGPITVTFSQANTAITGTLTVPGSSCVGNGGAISGQLTRDTTSPSGWSITFGNVAVAGGVGANAISFTGAVDSASHLQGTFGVHAPCATDRGDWNLYISSNALLAVCADCVHAPGFISTNVIPMWSATTPPTLTNSNMAQDAAGVITVGPNLQLNPSDGVLQSIGSGAGLFGWDKNPVGATSGVIGRTDGDNGAAVLGRATACTAATPCTPTAASPNAGFTAGVRGVADGTTGYGVRGFAASATGTTHGVEGRVVSKDGRGAEGWNTSSANDGLPIGVYGRTFGAKGIAVSGQATTTADINTDSTIGVLGQGKTGTAGFSGLDQGAAGVWGANFAPTGWTRGVLAQIFSPGGEALAVEAPQGGNLIVGRGLPNYATVFRVTNNGEVHANGGLFPSGADFAESLRVGGKREDYAPGDVLIIDSAGSRQVTRSTQPYSPLVAGIYSTKPGVLASPHGMGGADTATQVPLAIVGIVPCKVSAENGPVETGDLLVTASTPGHAMKGTDRGRMLGAVVGKALQPMHEGTGLIEVLVTLQ